MFIRVQEISIVEHWELSFFIKCSFSEDLMTFWCGPDDTGSISLIVFILHDFGILRRLCIFQRIDTRVNQNRMLIESQSLWRRFRILSRHYGRQRCWRTLHGRDWRNHKLRNWLEAKTRHVMDKLQADLYLINHTSPSSAAGLGAR